MTTVLRMPENKVLTVINSIKAHTIYVYVNILGIKTEQLWGKSYQMSNNSYLVNRQANRINKFDLHSREFIFFISVHYVLKQNKLTILEICFHFKLYKIVPCIFMKRGPGDFRTVQSEQRFTPQARYLNIVFITNKLIYSSMWTVWIWE